MKARSGSCHKKKGLVFFIMMVLIVIIAIMFALFWNMQGFRIGN